MVTAKNGKHTSMTGWKPWRKPTWKIFFCNSFQFKANCVIRAGREEAKPAGWRKRESETQACVMKRKWKLKTVLHAKTKCTYMWESDAETGGPLQKRNRISSVVENLNRLWCNEIFIFKATISSFTKMQLISLNWSNIHDVERHAPWLRLLLTRFQWSAVKV